MLKLLNINICFVSIFLLYALSSFLPTYNKHLMCIRYCFRQSLYSSLSTCFIVALYFSILCFIHMILFDSTFYSILKRKQLTLREVNKSKIIEVLSEVLGHKIWLYFFSLVYYMIVKPWEEPRLWVQTDLSFNLHSCT